jgi:hypothetical protein
MIFIMSLFLPHTYTCHSFLFTYHILISYHVLSNHHDARESNLS